MTATMSDIRQLRRYIAEPTQDTYTDADLLELIEAKPVPDTDNHLPSDTDWTPTYDLYAVASEIWIEKSSAVADEFDFTADGGSFQRSQKMQMCIKQSGYYKSRSKALSLQTKLYPLTHLNSAGWEDTEYKDEIDDYESDLT